MPDLGLTHVAYLVSDLAKSLDFYERYAAMTPVHDRKERGGARVAWLTDHTRPFVVVLIQPPGPRVLRSFLARGVSRLLPSLSHLGVACESRAVVDEFCNRAREEGILDRAPTDAGPPVGYFGFVRDPDGHALELAFGQDVGLTVEAGDRSGSHH